MKKRKRIINLSKLIESIKIIVQSFSSSKTLPSMNTPAEHVDIYDDAGIKMVPLSAEAMELLEYGNPDDGVNNLTAEDIAKIPAMNSMVVDGAIIIVMCVIATWGGILAVSQKICKKYIDYFKTYGYVGHSKVFNNVTYQFTNSKGQAVSKIITQQMIEATAQKLSSLENGTTWEPVVGLTDDDKLCLTYAAENTMGFTKFYRENIQVKSVNTELEKKYPYYAMVAYDTGLTGVYQYCFDKKPIGAFKNAAHTVYAYDMKGKRIYFKNSNTIFYSNYAIRYDNGVATLCLEICKLCIYNYALNNTTGLIENTGSYTEWAPEIYQVDDIEYPLYTGPVTDGRNRHLPFNVFVNAIRNDISSSLINSITNTPNFEEYFTEQSFSINNSPRITNAGSYYDSLPDIIDTKEGINLDDYSNLYGVTTYLNPTGVSTWADLQEINSIGEIANGYSYNEQNRYGYGKCEECAEKMKEFLLKKKLHGSMIMLKWKPRNSGIIWSDYAKKSAGDNGLHVGIQYQGKVYCNVHPYGLPKQQWIDDFNCLPPAKKILPPTEIEF